MENNENLTALSVAELIKSEVEKETKALEEKFSKLPSFVPEKQEVKEEKKVNIKDTLRKVLSGQYKSLTFDKTINSELSDAAGAYLVPMEYGNELISTLNQYGTARKYCTIKNMTKDKMRFPRVSTDLTAYNPAEGGIISASNFVFDTVDLDATKYAVLCPLTNELINDTSYDLMPEVINSAKIGFGNKEDALLVSELGTCTNTLTITGSISSGSFTGSYAYGKLQDVITTLEGVNTNYINGASWVMSPTVKGYIRKVTDTTGQPIMQSAQGTQPETLLGYPIVTSNASAAATAASGSSVLYFGNLQNVYFGDRNQYSLYVAQEGTVGSTSLLETDMSAYRLTERVDIELARDDAFIKLNVN